MEDERIVRIEAKIDDLAETMRALVAVQRDIHHLEKNYDRLQTEHDELEKKVNTVVRDETQSSTSSSTFEKLILFFISALLGGLGSYLAFATGS